MTGVRNLFDTFEGFRRLISLYKVSIVLPRLKTLFLLVLQQFRDHKGRNPSVGEDAEDDRQFLYKLCDDVTKQQNISSDLINKEFVK